MPRSKVGKKRAPVNIPQLTSAARLCLTGEVSIREAAQRYNVSKTTLIRHINSFKKSGEAEFSYHAQNNTQQVFTIKEENALKEYLLTAARLHYGLTKREVRSFAFQYAAANNKKFPDSWVAEKAAGKEWLRHYLTRHIDLSLRKPEATSLARSTSFNKTNVMTFFKNYKEALSRAAFPPHKIWNCDETGMTTVHVPPKILGPKGIKQLGQMTSGERGQNVTMIAAINAIGNHIPSMMIFPRVHFKEHMIKGAPNGTIGAANKSGWSNEQLFLQYLQHFKQHVKPTVEEPVILTLDNHDSHVSVDAIDFCKENGIIMVTFHPHTSHKMQPLDRTVFGPFKTYYNTAASEWMIMHPGQPLTIYEIAELVGTAFPKAFTTSNIQKGFEISGLYPVNENIFHEHEYLSSYVTDRPLDTQVERKAATVEEQTVEELDMTVSTNYALPSLSATPITSDATGTPNTSNATASSSTSYAAPNAASAELFQSRCRSPTPITPEMLRPYPKALPRKKLSGRPRGKSRILTDTPEKKEIMEMKNKSSNTKKVTRQLVRKPKQKKNNVKRKESESEDEGEESYELTSSQDESWDDIIAREIEQLAEKKLEPIGDRDTIDKGAFVLVKVAGKKTFCFYIAEVIDIENKEIKYLRRIEKSNKFINDATQTYAFNLDDVVCKLPTPHSVGGTARHSSILQFDVGFSGYNVQ